MLQNKIFSNKFIIQFRKISLFSLLGLAIVNLFCFFILKRLDFYAVLVSSFVNLVLFLLTLVSYQKISASNNPSKIKYVFLLFLLKLAISALAFFIIYYFKVLSPLVYLISFLIFFTVFFNLEIFLIYKRILKFGN